MFFRTLITLVVTSLMGPLLFAQQDAGHRHLNRFVDGMTLAVGQFDLQKMDLAATLKLLESFNLPGDDIVRKHLKQFQVSKEGLAKRNIHQLYLLYHQISVFDGPVLYVPLPDKSKAAEVASLISFGDSAPFRDQPTWFTQRMKTEYAIVDDYLVVGASSTVMTMKAVKPVPRPELAEALAKSQAAPMQLFLIPSTDFRKVIAETLPKLPPELGTGSMTKLLAGIEWVYLQGSLPDRIEGSVTIQTKEPAQAQEIDKLWQAMMKTMKQWASEPYTSPNFKVFQRIASELKPEVQGTIWSLGASADRLKPMTQVLAESFAKNAGDEHNTKKLRDMLIAMHNFHGDFNRMPNQCIMSKDGKPLLSWRVQLLPYLGHEELYKEFNFDEPWDSDHNKKLLSKMPDIFKHPSAKNVPADHTVYQVFYSKKATKPGAAILEDGKMTLGMLTAQDGTSNTFVITDAAAKAVPWTKPEDLLFDGTVENLPKLSSPKNNGWAHVVFGDGSVRAYNLQANPKLLRQLIGRNDGENMDTSELFERK
jgi:hypothetical protein